MENDNPEITKEIAAFSAVASRSMSNLLIALLSTLLNKAVLSTNDVVQMLDELDEKMCDQLEEIGDDDSHESFHAFVANKMTRDLITRTRLLLFGDQAPSR